MINLGVCLDFAKFLCIYILIIVIIHSFLKKLPDLIKKFTLKYKDISVSFDFYVDTKTESTDPNDWTIKKNSKELETLSLKDFKFFVINKLFLQVLLTKNDLDNFEKIYKIYEEELPDESTIFEKYYQRNYKFNIKFEEITKIVKSFKETNSEVLKDLKKIFKENT